MWKKIKKFGEKLRKTQKKGLKCKFQPFRLIKFIKYISSIVQISLHPLKQVRLNQLKIYPLDGRILDPH